MPYCFSRSSQISRSHGSKNRQIGGFRTVTQVWIHQWLHMMHKAWSGIKEVPYCFSRSSVKFQGHTAQKIDKLDPNWAFPDCNSSFNSPMATYDAQSIKEVPYCFSRSYVNLQGRTPKKKLSNFTQIRCSRTVTPVWIQWWIWNYTQLDVV